MPTSVIKHNLDNSIKAPNVGRSLVKEYHPQIRIGKFIFDKPPLYKVFEYNSLSLAR